jgi:hypothetical protein
MNLTFAIAVAVLTTAPDAPVRAGADAFDVQLARLDSRHHQLELELDEAPRGYPGLAIAGGVVGLSLAVVLAFVFAAEAIWVGPSVVLSAFSHQPVATPDSGLLAGALVSSGGGLLSFIIGGVESARRSTQVDELESKRAEVDERRAVLRLERIEQRAAAPSTP